MSFYADTSFIIKLAVFEPGAEAAMAEYRRLDYPALPFLAIHRLEVRNAIRQRVFMARLSRAGRERAAIFRECDSALGRVARWTARGWLLDREIDFDEITNQADRLSEKHTRQMGCRAFDLLHVAAASKLGCKEFLTCDKIQSNVARAEGLSVIVPTH
jgi:predicted nucleic acid-binding protein